METVQVTINIDTKGDPGAWDWDTVIRRGAKLGPNDELQVLDVYVE